MKQSPLERRITDIAAPIIADLGFELVRVTHTSESGAQVLQIMAEDPATGRLGVDDCAKLSKAVAAALDVEDPINGAYRLELSSPGIDRPLVHPKDFERFKGFEIKLETLIPAENGQKRFRGRIIDISNDKDITLATDQGEIVIDYNALAKAKLVMSDELIKTLAPPRDD